MEESTNDSGNDILEVGEGVRNDLLQCDGVQRWGAARSNDEEQMLNLSIHQEVNEENLNEELPNQGEKTSPQEENPSQKSYRGDIRFYLTKGNISDQSRLHPVINFPAIRKIHETR